MLDLVGRPVNEGDFVVYATKTEAPSLQFGWIEQIKVKEHERRDWRSDDTYVQFEYKIKIRHAEADGTRKNKTDFRQDPVTGEYGYQDTGVASTAWLTDVGHSKVGEVENIVNSSRLLVTQPI